MRILSLVSSLLIIAILSRDQCLCAGVQKWLQQCASQQWRATLLYCATVSGGRASFLYEISSSHGGEYDVQSCLLGYTHPWWWRQYAPLKRRSTIILHGSISQKTTLNIMTVVLSCCVEISFLIIFRIFEIIGDILAICIVFHFSLCRYFPVSASGFVCDYNASRSALTVRKK
jgi:hypothetical protein